MVCSIGRSIVCNMDREIVRNKTCSLQLYVATTPFASSFLKLKIDTRLCSVGPL